jgi:trehalose/maltose hydrolase-like predicted phosphorylase
MKTYCVTELRPSDPPAYVSNGFVGLRLNQVPLLRPTALVNGAVQHHPLHGTTETARAPFPLGLNIGIGRYWLRSSPEWAVFRSQSYDYTCGELTSHFDLVTRDTNAQVEVVTLCSRTLPTIALQQVTITVDRPCRLTLASGVSIADLPGQARVARVLDEIADMTVLWEAHGGLSTIGCASAVEFVGDDLVATERSFFNDMEGYQTDRVFRIDAQPGRTYRVRQFGALVPNVLHNEPHWQAVRLIGQARSRGWETLRSENRTAWAEVWKGRVHILGAAQHWQDISDAAFFYLHSSMHPASPQSVAAFGLSGQPLYQGHIFWDAETFLFPPLLLTAPRTARAMLDYRSQRLPSARNNAALQGYDGILFPWESSLYGDEVTPYQSASGWQEQHVNMAVAVAFAQYVYATGDTMFLREQAWPVLRGVAEWIVSRVTHTTAGYTIRNVMGADELTANVTDNAYTNMLVAVALREAGQCATMLGLRPPAIWQTIATRMVVPLDVTTQAILKHSGDTGADHRAVPEVLAAFFPFGYRTEPHITAATYKRYLDPIDRYLGHPMFSALCGLWAARTGDRVRARELFERGIQAFVVPPFHSFSEWGSGANPCFLTNPAGFLLALMYGLTGIELDAGVPEAWGKHPIVMPDGWDGILIERVWVHNQPVSLGAYHGEAQMRLRVE